MNDVSTLEKASAITFLIFLLQHGGSMPVTRLLHESGIHPTTFYARKRELIEAGLIREEGKIIDREGKVIKTIAIVLTPKGKKVAERLVEIKEIMEEK